MSLMSMFFVSALSAGISTFGLRPGIGLGSKAKLATLGEKVARVAESKSLKDIESLQFAAGIADSILLENANATEHMTDEDKRLLEQVKDMVRDSIFGSMDSSNAAANSSIYAALEAISECNSVIHARVEDGGDLKQLGDEVAKLQRDVDKSQEKVDDYRVNNDTAFNAVQKFISEVPNPQECPGLPDPRTYPAVDLFFEGSAYVRWYETQKAGYEERARFFERQDYLLKGAITQMLVDAGQREVAYCDWKVETESAVAIFDKCYADESQAYGILTQELTSDSGLRIQAYEAGVRIIAMIDYLLALSTDSTPPENIDPTRYTLTFPEPDVKGDYGKILEELSSDRWVPTPDCAVSQNDWHLTPPGERFCNTRPISDETQCRDIAQQISRAVNNASLSDILVKIDTHYPPGCVVDLRRGRIQFNPHPAGWQGSPDYFQLVCTGGFHLTPAVDASTTCNSGVQVTQDECGRMAQSLDELGRIAQQPFRPYLVKTDTHYPPGCIFNDRDGYMQYNPHPHGWQGSPDYYDLVCTNDHTAEKSY